MESEPNKKNKRANICGGVLCTIITKSVEVCIYSIYYSVENVRCTVYSRWHANLLIQNRKLLTQTQHKMLKRSRPELNDKKCTTYITRATEDLIVNLALHILFISVRVLILNRSPQALKLFLLRKLQSQTAEGFYSWQDTHIMLRIATLDNKYGHVLYPKDNICDNINCI